MNSRSFSYVSVIVCLLLGTALIGLRYHIRHQATLAEQESRWQLGVYDRV